MAGLFPGASGMLAGPLGLGAAVAAVLVLLGGTGVAVARSGGRPLLSPATRVRLRMWPGPGFARGRALRRLGLSGPRRTARQSRPDLSRRDRLLGPWQEYASFTGWAHGWVRPRRVYSSMEQIKLLIGPPRKGKSAAAAGSVIDAPGPAVVTSIRGDLIDSTASMRARRGRILVFNPEQVGGFGTTVTWNPVSGCEDMTVAARRAGYMVEGVSGKGLEDASFWQDQASVVLGAYLHAAGLAGGSMRDVHRWVSEDDEQPARILEAHPGAEPAALSEARAYLALPDRTRAGVSATIRSAVKFMTHPACSQVLCPDGPGTFDPAAFVRSCDTLYLVAGDAKFTPVPPVFTALVAEVVHAARLAAAVTGRLCPPLTLELDEVANVAPVPVSAWATWAAGSGVLMHVYAQAWAQLAERWGEHGAATLWQSADVKVIYCESTEDQLCRLVEQACGQVRVRPRGGKEPAALEPVLPYAVLREMPKGRAVVLQGGSPPVIVRTERNWERSDVRKAARRGDRHNLPAAVPLPVPVPQPELMLLSAASEAEEDPFLAAGWPPAGWPAFLPGGQDPGGSRDAGPAYPGAFPAQDPQRPSFSDDEGGEDEASALPAAPGSVVPHR